MTGKRTPTVPPSARAPRVRSRKRIRATATAALLTCAALVACSSDTSDADVRLLPITDLEIGVDESLVLPLTVDNPSGVPLTWSYDAPGVAEIDRVARLAGTPVGAEFRWTPLASQVGTHELTFTAAWDGGRSAQATRITVVPSAAAAPVFLRPSAGGAHDLARDPCVVVDVEVRDDDSTEVTLALVGNPPDGATLTATGPKSGLVEWCPTADQVDAAQRWTLTLSAADETHDPVLQDYIAVLQTPAKEGCPGDDPVISVRQPSPGATVASEAGYAIVADVTDDIGLREAPLLYWALGDDPGDDLTGYAQVEFVAADGQWAARVPPLGVPDGEVWPVSVVVVATDNDDAEGAGCDHTVRSPRITFDAAPGRDTSVVAACAPCETSASCVSGVCGSVDGRALCVDPCASCPDTCRNVSTREGTIASGCPDACVATVACTDDAAEPNDDRASAEPIVGAVSGTVCAGDEDFWRVESTGGAFVVTLTFSHAAGDLDLRLLDEGGAIVATSEGTSDTEEVALCADDGAVFYAQVLGFSGATGAYTLSTGPGSGECGCAADDNEPNDDVFDATSIVGGAFAGTLCPGDVDHFDMTVLEPSTLSIAVSFDGEAVDIDIELIDAAGAIIDSSETVGDEEAIDVEVPAGIYTLRVYAYDDGVGAYTGTFAAADVASCADTGECPIGTVCAGGTCSDPVCDGADACPVDHLCPTVGPGDPARSCAQSCNSTADCRAGETCKRFPEGRACAVAGRGATGDPCSDASDCAGDRACLDVPDGMCAAAGCERSDCGPSDVCVELAGVWACARDCALGSFLCRPSQTCAVRDDPSDSPVFACVP